MSEPTPQKRSQMVAQFARAMVVALEANSHKGGWTADTPDQLADRLLMEVAELLYSVGVDPADILGLLLAAAQRVNVAHVTTTPRDAATVVRKGANVANYALMVVDNAARSALAEVASG
jgi:hypothetical protein